MRVPMTYAHFSTALEVLRRQGIQPRRVALTRPVFEELRRDTPPGAIMFFTPRRRWVIDGVEVEFA